MSKMHKAFAWKLETVKMREGEKLNRNPKDPVIEIVGTGKHTYLWVGNDAADDKMCFATKSGPKTLERFAVNILRALKSTKLK